MLYAKKTSALPYWLTGVAIIGFIALAIAFQITKPVAKDEKGCLAIISGKTVFVIDQSDSLSSQTRSEILARVTKIINEKVKVGDLVSVFSITELSKKNLIPMFSYCKQQQTAEGPAQTQRYVTANYSKKFMQPLFAAINSPIIGSKQSPIAQAMIDLSLSDYLKHPASSRLVVFSDFMEFTERFSLYSRVSDKEAIAKFRLSRGASVARPTFSGVDVQLHIIPRAEIDTMTGKSRDMFWKWFFTDNNGSSAGLDLSYLPG